MAELTYRAVSADDGPSLAVVLSEPRVARWLRPLGNAAPFTLAECAARAVEDAAHWAAHGFGPWVALDSHVVVGHGGLRHRVLNGRAELEVAWAVVASRWGQGVATAIGRTAIAFARRLGVDEIVAFTRVDNLASLRVMEKLSMTREHEFQHAGHPHVLARVNVSG